ncbi:tetratricopeptide repeat protein, partial [Candidatus Bathyarchaeota archaeon]|nr:tetratricopeptide repeat protein [Candidatus Bathyarchaeota archaeon]
LTMASFVGKDFTFEALRGVAGVEEDKLLEIIEKMFKTGLLKHMVVRGEDMCSFADIIVRDVVHEEINPFRRKKLHGVVGIALEKVYVKNIDEHLGELALHFLEGGDKEKALGYFLKAGEKAAKIYANSEAASYFQSALKLLEEKEGELRERGRVLEKVGDIKRLVGEFSVCLKYWNEALLLWKKLNEKENLSRLHRKMAMILSEMGDVGKAKEYVNRALKFLETEPESVELTKVYESMAGGLWVTGDMDEALSWAEKALELAKKLNDSEVIASSYATLGVIISLTGDTKKGSECLERALKMALDHGYMETALRCYVNLGSLLTAEENERRLECGEKGFELAKNAGHITYESWFGINLADLYMGMGDIDKAMSLAEESAALDRKAGNMANLSLSIGILGNAYQILGEWDKSEQCYKEALGISRKVSDVWASELYVALGQFYLLVKKEYVKARENLEKSYEICEKAGVKYDQMWYSRFLSWTYIELGEVEKAKNLIGSLYKFARETKHKEFIAKADALRAMLFRTQKKWKESIRHFEKSLREHEALDARRWHGYMFAKMILYEYARVYLERDQEGDREKAYDLLNQALEIFQKIGAKKDIEKTKSRMIYLETGREMVAPETVAEVPEVVLPSHVATGYADLDDLLFGGIPRNYAVILTSPSCDERDLLIKSFLEVGPREDQITFYITTRASGMESLEERFPSSFYPFICNPEADAIIKSLPNVFKLKGVENLNDINIALSSAFRKLDRTPKKTRRVCIEIVSDVLLQHHTVQTRRWLNALVPKLKSKGFTTLAVMNPEMHSPQEVHAILGLFEGEINIYEKETEKGLEKFLKIKKMTNQKYSKSELALREERLQE